MRFQLPAPNRYEAMLETCGPATGGLAPAMAMASRRARSQVRADSPRAAVIRDFAASVMGPTLVGYTLWLLQQARQHRLSRLYFLARDGEILLRLARVLAARLQMDCDLRYLYASRIAWGIPAIVRGDLTEMAWLLERDSGPDLNRLLTRLGLASVDLDAGLNQLGLTTARRGVHFSPADRQTIKSDAFLDLIRPHLIQSAREKRRLLLGYLGAEGLLQDDRYAIVDVGWHGTLQDCLARVLATQPAAMGAGLYFGLIRYATDPEFGTKAAYFTDHQQNSGPQFPMPDLYYLIEIMCAGTEGTLTGFAADATTARVRPQLQQSRNRVVLDWGLPLLHETVLRFAEALRQEPGWQAGAADGRAATAQVLGRFLSAPTRAEAEMIAGFPFEGGMANDVPPWVAAKPYTWSQFGESFRHGALMKDDGTFWAAGSLALTPPLTKAALKGAVKAGKNFRKAPGYPGKIARLIRRQPG